MAVLVPWGFGCTIALNAIVGGVQRTTLSAPEIVQAHKRCEEDAKRPVDLEHERALGGGIAVNWVHRSDGLALKTPSDMDLERYLNQLGKFLSGLSKRPDLAWTFGVLESPSVNALSAPGGYVLVTRGLLQKLHSEAELAGVLAHEIAHVTERHAIAAYQDLWMKTCQSNVWSSPVKEALTSTLPLEVLKDPIRKQFDAWTDSISENIAKVGFQQDQEYVADRVGMELLLNAGYSPWTYVAFVGSLPGGGGWFPNHPPPHERERRLRAYLNGFNPKGRTGEGDSDTPLVAADYPFDTYASPPLSSKLAVVSPP
jgi:predicted Zn-dependent protease